MVRITSCALHLLKMEPAIFNEKKNMDKAKLIEELICYATKNLSLKELDSYYVRNILMRKFKVDKTYDGEIDKKAIEELSLPDILIEKIKELAKEEHLVEEGDEDLFACEIMGDLSLLPQNFVDEFHKIAEEKDKQAALDWAYDYEIKNNYIAKSAIDKNIVWSCQDGKRHVEISINLSKPEKTNKDIAKAKAAPATGYPKCALCIENLGFKGGNGKPPRENIRIVPLTLCGNPWFLQYSPYGYYYQHAIVINTKHSPMFISRQTFANLLSFLDVFPTYFVGSNADLPIVGGSILAHEHYQGGRHRLPVYDSADLFEIEHKNFQDLKITYLDWYNSVIKISGKNKEEIVEVADKLFEAWKNYDDQEVKIIHKTTEQHSTVTPIAIYENGLYNLYLILRNNRTDEENPEGIFHAHKEYHNIKQESIGLIEAMGLFILPARLKRQFNNIKNILSNDKYDIENMYATSEDMKVHKDMIEKLILSYGRRNTLEEAEKHITEYVNNTCINILKNTAVFKEDEQGQKALKKFLTSINL